MSELSSKKERKKRLPKEKKEDNNGEPKPKKTYRKKEKDPSKQTERKTKKKEEKLKKVKIEEEEEEKAKKPKREELEANPEQYDTFGSENIEDEDLEAIDDLMDEKNDYECDKISIEEMKLKKLQEMNPVDYERYLYLKRSSIDRKEIKKQMGNIIGTPVTSKVALTMAGITKMYIGDIIDQAKIVMSEFGDTGPIRPNHIQEAYRRISNH